MLRTFAVHAETGEPMPEALLDKVLAARRFNQGFATVEYTASALVDLDLHLLDAADDLDVIAHEKAVLDRIGMPDVMVMRHRSPHFQHIFSGGYAAGYYSYLWSEVLDADAFEAFEEAGDPFDAATAKRLHDHIYSAGYRRDPAEAYTAFRGRLPTSDALLRKRGLEVANAVNLPRGSEFERRSSWWPDPLVPSTTQPDRRSVARASRSAHCARPTGSASAATAAAPAAASPAMRARSRSSRHAPRP